MASLYEPLFRHVLFPAYESGLRRRKTLAYLREYERQQWLDPEQIDALQWRKLQALLRQHIGHVLRMRQRGVVGHHAVHAHGDDLVIRAEHHRPERATAGVLDVRLRQRDGQRDLGLVARISTIQVDLVVDPGGQGEVDLRVQHRGVGLFKYGAAAVYRAARGDAVPALNTVT